MSETTNPTEQAAPVATNPKDLTFIIDGEQINSVLSVLGKLPYEQVFQAIDIFRSLKRVEVKYNAETKEA